MKCIWLTILVVIVVVVLPVEFINSLKVASAESILPELTSPKPLAAKERSGERIEMVEAQIAHPKDNREVIQDPRVLQAMKEVPRHVFVPKRLRSLAYRDSPLPIGSGQTISQPYIVALMTELLELSPNATVLEIGTGSGYQAAVLAHLTKNVFSVEIIGKLANRASKTLKEQRYTSVKSKHADGYYGWEEHAPFDAIIVTCAAGHLPPPLWKQLKPGGRIVIPIGSSYQVQRLVVIRKTTEGKRRSRSVTDVRFVPLLRESTQ